MTKKPPSRLPWLCPSLRIEAHTAWPPASSQGPKTIPHHGIGRLPSCPGTCTGVRHWAKWNFTQGELVSEPPGPGCWLAGPLPSSRATGSRPAALGHRCFKRQVLAIGLEQLAAFPSRAILVWRRMRCPKLCPAGPGEEAPSQAASPPGPQLRFHRKHLVLAFVIFRNPAFFYLILCDNLFTFYRANQSSSSSYRNTCV